MVNTRAQVIACKTYNRRFSECGNVSEIRTETVARVTILKLRR